MEDFDEKRRGRLSRQADELTFKICGETIVARGAVKADLWTAYWDDLSSRFSQLTNTEQLAAMDRHIEACIEPDSIDAYRRARAMDGDLAVSVAELHEIIEFIWKAHTSRPTGAPSDSSDGRESTTQTLTDISRSPVST